MAETMTRERTESRRGGGLQEAQRSKTTGQADEAEQHSEGTLARAIEQQTAKLPSDTFLWGAIGCIAGSWLLHAMGRKDEGNFVGQWVPTLLIFGLYNKLVKVAGSDRTTA